MRPRRLPWAQRESDEQPVTTWRYEDIHAEQRNYVILPGHMPIAGEEILEENSYYEILKKAA